MGFVFDKSGVRCYLKRIEGVKKQQPPKNACDTLSFLSMMQYSSRFIRDLSSISEPLRKLTRSSQPWEWNVEKQRAFNLLKDRLCENIVSYYFDPTRHSTVVCYGSPVGIASALYQTDDNGEMRLICFVSRALTAVEQRYSQTCREATSVVYEYERLHQYLCNSDFTVLSDHLLLKTIFGNQSTKFPVRLERLCFRLQPYQFTFGDVAGEHNLSDYYSRHQVNQARR